MYRNNLITFAFINRFQIHQYIKHIQVLYEKLKFLCNTTCDIINPMLQID